MITEDDLRAAAETIDQASDAELQRKLSQLKAVRQARTQLEVLRQQAELDSLELDQAAYQLASQAQSDGDLPSAARWYRVAADNDFADAPFRLAKVLDDLAAKHLTSPESRLATREEMDLVSEAARWYAAAYAAGDIEAGDLLDTLVARHDFTRPRARPALAIAAKPGDPEAATCERGGLKHAMKLQLKDMTDHVTSCRPCLDEFIKLQTHLPVAENPAHDNEPASTPADDTCGPPASVARLRSALHIEASEAK